MKRRLFNLAAAVSLVLCLSALGMCVATWRRLDALSYNTANASWQICSTLGSISASRSVTPKREIYDRWHRFSIASDYFSPRPVPRTVLKFRWGYEKVPVGGGTTSTRWYVRVPYWFIVLLTAVPPALWLRATRARRRRRASKQCITCGYDLRATPDRCPECGAVAATEASMGDIRAF